MLTLTKVKLRLTHNTRYNPGDRIHIRPFCQFINIFENPFKLELDKDLNRLVAFIEIRKKEKSHKSSMFYCNGHIYKHYVHMYVLSSALWIKSTRHYNFTMKVGLTLQCKFHFNKKNHQISDMKMSIIEKIHKKDRFYLLEREKHFIRKFNTKYLGMNRNC